MMMALTSDHLVLDITVPKWYKPSADQYQTRVPTLILMDTQDIKE